jgi:hypothetical protein
MGSGRWIPLPLVRLSFRPRSAEGPEAVSCKAQKGKGVTFEEWLEAQPYRNLINEGTIMLMRYAWDARGAQMVIPIASSLSGSRGDIRD